MRLATAVAVLALLVLVGCGETKLKQGTVIGKVHEPESTTLVMVPITTGCSKYGCTTVLVPFYNHDGEDWKLQLRGDGKTGVAYVDEATFDREKIGDHFDADASKASFSDPNNSKREK